MCDKVDYKNTLNLPQTSFPMKAGLTQLEPKLLAKWSEEKIYHQMMELRKDAKPWVLHDGPPYANGHIHMGHALNKILKDIIVKSKVMAGFYSPYVPGWDCHGLPIEHQVDKLLGSKKRTLSQGDIRRQCRQYAEKFVAIQSEEFQRLGVVGEWEKPYLTMSYEYEATIARELGNFALSGSLFQSPKPVLWCGSCRTALAEAEVEYENHSSPSIYVAFPLKSDPAALSPCLAGEKVFWTIWTTTPWTIPSNLAIAYNPEFKYSAWRLADGRVLVMATELAESVAAKIGQKLEKVVDLETKTFAGTICRHPWYDRESPILPALYVTLEQGTGLVHTAPGHGREDYETGLANGLAPFSPLDAGARYTKEVPEWEGEAVLNANPAIIEHLKSVGALLATENIDHQYPHCWRCKKPVVFRSTPQWFISMAHNDLRKKALEAIGGVTWVPKWGRERIYGMIENRPDWCISRQRSWGVPITIFFCQDCGQWHYSEKIQEFLFQLIKEKGADAWFDLDTKELLPPGEKCPQCSGTNFEKETDILDVWFDSACSFVDTMEGRDYLPDISDLYLEGSDQHRGWFHSALLMSIGTRGRAPYRTVLTHGYVVDGNGRKMSKSLGNTIGPEEVIKKYGADILRLWASAENYCDDIRISPQIIDMLAKAYFNFRNSSRFILGNLADFKPAEHAVTYAELSEMDRFTLHQLNTLIGKIKEAYDSYEFHTIYHLINNFVVHLSSFYHDVVKDRLYTLAAGDKRRRGTQTVMHTVLTAMTRLMAPILSFTCEEIWSYLPDYKAGQSVFLEDLPAVNEEWNKPELAATWEKLLAARHVVLKELELARREKTIGSSLEAEVEITAGGETLELLKQHQDSLAEILIVSAVKLTEGPADGEMVVKVSPSDAPKCPRCWVHSCEVTANSEGVCSKCADALQK